MEEYYIYQIINSHTHPDHSAGNWIFKDTVENIVVPVEGFSTSGNIVALSERFTNPDLAEYWRQWVGPRGVMKFQDCSPTAKYDEKSEFSIGETTLLPIRTPGHTIDHYILYEPSHKILFSFDIDLTSFGPWYGHRESSITDFKNSLKKIIDLEINTLVSSHFGIVQEQIKDKIRVFSQIIEDRTDRIQQLLTRGITSTEELIEKAPIYGSFPYAEPLLRYWEGEMIRKHVAELQKRGDFLDLIV
jgi:glyoxylase-like metal-dependent hydrolase (beta-lactamase superfamily II)